MSRKAGYPLMPVSARARIGLRSPRIQGLWADNIMKVPPACMSNSWKHNHLLKMAKIVGDLASLLSGWSQGDCLPGYLLSGRDLGLIFNRKYLIMRIQGFVANHGSEVLRCENFATFLAVIRCLRRPLYGYHHLRRILLRSVLLRPSNYSGNQTKTKTKTQQQQQKCKNRF